MAHRDVKAPSYQIKATAQEEPHKPLAKPHAARVRTPVGRGPPAAKEGGEGIRAKGRTMAGEPVLSSAGVDALIGEINAEIRVPLTAVPADRGLDLKGARIAGAPADKVMAWHRKAPRNGPL